MTPFTFNQHGVCTNPITLRSHRQGSIEIEVTAAQCADGLWRTGRSVRSYPNYYSGCGVSNTHGKGYPDQQTALCAAADSVLKTLTLHDAPASIINAVKAWKQPAQLSLF